MKKDLKMEIYASKIPVPKVEFYTYTLKTTNLEASKFQLLRGACRRIATINKCGAFEDGEYIYTTEEIDGNISNVDFSLEYQGKRELEVLQKRKVYSSYIRYCIIQHLSQKKIFDKYNKYSCRNDITTKWIYNDGQYGLVQSRNKDISLERKFYFNVEIRDDGYAYLQLDTTSVFASNKTIADLLKMNISVLGMNVKNIWGKNRQSGILEEVRKVTVTDTLEFGCSLKDYYTERRKEGYLVEKIEDNTPVIRVRLDNNSTCDYYPQALVPVLTRENVEQVDSRFSRDVENLIKRDMAKRLEQDQLFIGDIGSIEELNGLSFDTECCDVEKLGLKKGRVELPQLVCENGRKIGCGNEYQVFSKGFYKKTRKEIKIGYIYPEGQRELLVGLAKTIVQFVKYGKFNGEEDKYLKRDLLNVHVKPMLDESYIEEDITDYKRVANKLKKSDDIDMVIALVPDGIKEDSPYNPFKTIWAEANIPSQMVSIKSAKTIIGRGSNSKYYLQNIVLGILGKTGGIPWIVENMPGEVDCFVGLDVATAEAGIHYPACSVMFDKFGRLLGFYKPKKAQKGEKIENRMLQEIFDQVLLGYEEEYGEYPKNIMIHRDGFSNENDEWYEHYFASKGIAYSIVEIRKNTIARLVLYEEDEVKNPGIGYCVYNQEKAYLVTTSMKNKKGAPKPLLIEKKAGSVNMVDILKQILYLSQLHVGSTQKMRLPITTGYADKICKHREHVPEGKVDNKLFFL